jgi:hypothetical protein
MNCQQLVKFVSSLVAAKKRSGRDGLVEVILQNVDKLETHRWLSIRYGDRLRPQSPNGGAVSARDGSLQSSARLG